MKKSILILTLILISTVTFAQVQLKKDTVKTAVKSYTPDPARIYQVELSADQVQSLVQTSQYGIIPYLKAIKLPMDKLDNAQQYFNSVAATVADQFRKQYAADSIKAVLTAIKRK